METSNSPRADANGGARFAPAHFRELRAASGVTLEDISAQTKIPVRLLQDLEQENFAGFPGGIFARSYVRSYAAAAGLDADMVLARVIRKLPGDVDPHEAVVLCAKRRREMRPRRRLALPPLAAVARPAALALAIVMTVIGLWMGAPRIVGRTAGPLTSRPIAVTGIVATAPSLSASPIVTAVRQKPKPRKPARTVPPMPETVSPVSLELPVPPLY